MHAGDLFEVTCVGSASRISEATRTDSAFVMIRTIIACAEMREFRLDGHEARIDHVIVTQSNPNA